MQAKQILIIIPARYGSSRLPGKPLLKLGNKTMLEHVCAAAIQAAAQHDNVTVLVATDDVRILEHAADINVAAVMTPAECATGTDRIIAAIAALQEKPRAVINLQGDAPLTPVSALSAMIASLQDCEADTIVTPCKQLTWQQLDVLRANKINNPFSGTCVTYKQNHEALWFSKQIIPAIRNEVSLRQKSDTSPVAQHLGIYGYTYEALNKIAKLPQGYYEQLEGLEQLRWLEHGFKVTIVPLELADLNAWRGVDTVDDAKFVTEILQKL